MAAPLHLPRKEPDLEMYYGWKIVGVSFTTLFISIGFLFYSYGVFFIALEEEFGSSRFGISMGLALMNLTMGLAAPFIGRAVDRYSIRTIMITGAVLMAMGFFLSAQIRALWQFYVILGTILGLGEALLGMIPSQTLVANWFIRRRGTALGIATMGVSMSGMVMAPVSTYLIHEIGWRYTFIVYGLAGIGVVIPMVYFIVYNRPEERGLYPDGESSPGALPGGLVHSESAFETPEQKAADAIVHRNWTFKKVVTNTSFWSIALSISMCMHCIGAILTHMIPMSIDRGLNPTQAAFLLSLSAGVGVVGKVIFGWIADRMDTRFAVWISIAFQAGGAFIFTLGGDSHTMMQLAAASFGFGMGGVVPLWGSLIGETFGRENFGRIMGLMTPCMLPIQITGLPLAGYIYDTTGNYILVLYIFLGVYAASAFAMFFLGGINVNQRAKRLLTPSREDETDDYGI